MTNATHTPGPWHYSPDVSINGTKLVYAPDGYLVADAGRIPRRTESETLYNARLIAAAPELLEALELCIANMGWSSTERGRDAFDTARAAIAKATGSEQPQDNVMLEHYAKDARP